MSSRLYLNYANIVDDLFVEKHTDPMTENYQDYIEMLRRLPHELAAQVANLTPEALTTAHIPGEWTVAQNIHHLAEAQMALFSRFKAMVKEDQPTLMPFDQDAWAQTPDSTHVDIEDSLTLIRVLHRRWAILAESLTEDEWHRTGHHPENGDQTPAELLPYAAAHTQLHIDQIAETLAARD